MDLNSLRSEIDGIDDQLLELFSRRMDIVAYVAQYKLDNQLPVLHPGREEAILVRMAEHAEPELAGYTREFFAALMAVSRHMQEDIIKQH